MCFRTLSTGHWRFGAAWLALRWRSFCNIWMSNYPVTKLNVALSCSAKHVVSLIMKGLEMNETCGMAQADQCHKTCSCPSLTFLHLCQICQMQKHCVSALSAQREMQHVMLVIILPLPGSSHFKWFSVPVTSIKNLLFPSSEVYLPLDCMWNPSLFISGPENQDGG